MSEEIDINKTSSGNPETATTVASETSPSNELRMEVRDTKINVSKGTDDAQFVQELIQMAPDQLIPWEETSLPSLGLYYGWPDGTIHVRAMGQTAEKMLANQRLAQSGQSIDAMLNECCRLPEGFATTDLLTGDRLFLLYFIRGITHGNIYEFSLVCPNPQCENQSIHQYDLNELASTIRYANPSLGKEPFKVTLPYLSSTTGREVWVGLRFLRAFDTNEMLARRKIHKRSFARPANKPNSQQSARDIADSMINDNLEKMIVTIMGQQVDPFGVRAFISKLHSRDTSTIREWLRSNAPGIDTTIRVTCPECNFEIYTALPISDSFFRPVVAE